MSVPTNEFSESYKVLNMRDCRNCGFAYIHNSGGIYCDYRFRMKRVHECTKVSHVDWMPIINQIRFV